MLSKIIVNSRVIWILLVFYSLVGKELFAQQDPQFSQYMFSKMVFNPGFTGIDEISTVSLMYRDQWMGFDGAPRSQFISFDTPVEKAFGGIGFTILNDQIGTQRTTNFNFNYAPRIYWRTNSGDRRSLSAGLGLNLTQFSIDGSVFRSPDGYYEGGQTDHNDDAIPNGLASDAAIDMSFGTYYYASDFYIGGSMTHMLGSKLSIDQVTLNSSRNLFLMGGRAFDVGVDYVIMPSVLYKTTFRKSQLDINTNVQYNNEIWAGVGIRGVTRYSADAFVFNFGAHVTNQVSVGYAYDLTASSIGAFSGGTHEFLFKYRLLNFGIGQNRPETTYCPRHM